jgi:hypothetical protein
MPEHLANEIEAVAAGHGDRGEAVPKVMNAEIVEPARPQDALPGLLDADEMSVPALSGQNVWAALLSRQLASARSSGAPSGTVLAPVLLLGQYQAAALEIDPFPPVRPTKRLRED